MKKIVLSVLLLIGCLFYSDTGFSSVMPPHKKLDFTTKVAFTEEEKDWLKMHPSFIVGVLKDYYPYEYFDKTGQYKGIVSTYLYEIEKETGISFKIVPFEKLADAIVAFNRGEIDLFSLAINKKVENVNIVLSKPYLSFVLGIFTNEENSLLINSMSDLQGKKVAVSRDMMIYNPIVNESLDIKVVDKAIDGIKGVSSGIYDAYVGDIFHTKSIVSKIELGNIHFAYPMNMEPLTFNIGVSEKHANLVPLINKIMHKFNSINHSEVLEIWTKSNSDYPEKIETEYKRYLFMLSILFLSVLIGLSLWLWQIRSSSRKANELREDYKNLFDSTPVAMFVYRGNKIIYVNKAFADLVGEEPKSLLSGRSFDFINAGFIKPMKTNKSADKKNDVAEDVKIYDILGNVKYINLKNIDIKIGSQTQELIIAVDVTYRKVLEDERRDILKKVAGIQRMESVGLLASKVAHDFNNILAGVNGAAEFINLNMTNDNPLKKYPQIIVNACRRASYLTKQLLFFAKNKTHVMKNIDLNKCVEDGIDLLEQAVKKNSGVKVVAKLNAKDSHIMGNGDLLENIILNLGLNSRDALSQSGGKIIIETKNVILTKQDIGATVFDIDDGEFVELTVEDNGSGIPYDIQSKVFEPFFTTKGEEKGNGLGLFAVYGVVREHRATLKLESIPGNGTKISIYFPLIKSEKEMVKARKSKRKIKAKILVVDDEEILLGLLRDILEFLGAKVIVAKNYDEAVIQYKNNKDIDLVMLDVVMNGRGGLDVYKALRSMNENVRVVFVSGYAADDEISDMVPRNKNLGFIAKPYNVSEVLEKIAEVMSRK